MADDNGTAVQPPTEPLQVADIPPAPEPSISLKTPSSASRRVRARLARRMTAQRSALSPVLEPLVSVHRQIYPKADLSLLQSVEQAREQQLSLAKSAAACGDAGCCGQHAQAAHALRADAASLRCLALANLLDRNFILALAFWQRARSRQIAQIEQPQI